MKEITCPVCKIVILVSEKIPDLLFTDNPKIIGITCTNCNAVLGKEFIYNNIIT